MDNSSASIANESNINPTTFCWVRQPDMIAKLNEWLAKQRTMIARLDAWLAKERRR
jgi:hypothetical protein